MGRNMFGSFIRKSVLGAATALMILAGSLQSALAADNDVFRDVSATDIKNLLQLAGVTATISQDQVGNPLIFARAGDSKFVVRTFDCQVQSDASNRCRRMQYRAGFDMQMPPSRASMNEFNKTWVFGKAYVTDNGLAAIEYPVNLTSGVTEANLVHNFALWVSILQEFEKHIGGELTS